MNNEIKELIQLQEIDRFMDQYQTELDRLPRELDYFNEQVLGLKQNLEDKKKTWTVSQLKKKEKEVELGGCEEKMRKGEMELNTIKSNDAYKIKLKEIDQFKELKSGIEDEILVLMDEIDHTTSELKNIEQENKTIETQILIEKKVKESEIERVKQRYQEELKKREIFCEGKSKELLASYERIRKKRKGLVLASIIGESCGGCHTILTPGTINEVKKGKDLILCDSCSMILYIEEAPALDTKPAA